jgi:hypothetical protein
MPPTCTEKGEMAKLNLQSLLAIHSFCVDKFVGG